jgi:hypothetical protein
MGLVFPLAVYNLITRVKVFSKWQVFYTNLLSIKNPILQAGASGSHL